MIIDLQRFIAEARPRWRALEAMLDRLQADSTLRLDLEETRRLHYLYQRASADLAKVATFSSEPETRRYLESLVGRAYGQIHETRRRPHRFAPLRWFFVTFPQTFRRRVGAFFIALAVTLAGCLFGAGALAVDPEAKSVLLPFEHLQGDPSKRVEREEEHGPEAGAPHAAFSAFLMTHNIKVSIFAMALGLTWGIGTIAMLFFNGVILGAVALDYAAAGESAFLVGWLLPHGSIEIPAILLAGQAGLVLARGIVGWGRRRTIGARMREIGPDLCTLIGGLAVMLVWAGLIESFFSQVHEPTLPYELKIGFGVVELIALFAFLTFAGRGAERRDARERSADVA